VVTPAAKRKAVAHVVTVHGVSLRRACGVLAVGRSSIRRLRFLPGTAISTS
jgi:putative transposase